MYEVAVKASLNYLSEIHLTGGSAQPELYTECVSRSTLVMRAVDVAITDVRKTQHKPSLEEEGFTLVPHHSTVRDVKCALEAGKAHSQEVEGLIRELTGAQHVYMAPEFVVRYGEPWELTSSRANARPARVVHADYTAKSARRFARMRAAGRIEWRPERRLVVYNVWRPLTPPPQDIPLALCDARSVAEQDQITGTFVVDPPGGHEFRFEGLLFVHSARHRWFYFSNMRQDEALVFKTFDSDTTRVPRVPHSAFDDPTCPLDRPTRVSVECRVFALYDS